MTQAMSAPMGAMPRAAERSSAARFLRAAVVLYVCFGALLFSMRLLFVAANWAPLHRAGWREIARGLADGLMFDFAMDAYLMLPAFVLACVLAARGGEGPTGERRARPWLWRLLAAYLGAIALLVV